MLIFLLPLFAYLLGSISSAIITSRAMGLPDPREHGSGNPGATNVLRTGGKKAAIITLIGDLLKGLLPVLVAKTLHADDTTLALTALAAFLGHLFPVFFGFKGGKGVATAAGAFLGIHLGFSGILLAIWGLVAFTTHYSSLAALIASALAPFIAWWLFPSSALVLCISLISALLIYRHKSNIRHLINGTEKKSRLKK